MGLVGMVKYEIKTNIQQIMDAARRDSLPEFIFNNEEDIRKGFR